MAMAMIQKARPLVPMNEKPTTAAPDYETFQLLFRKADEFIQIESEPTLCEKLTNTEGIIEGGTRKKPFTTKQNELTLFKTIPTRTIIYPKSFTEEIRKIRVKKHKSKKNHYIIGSLPIAPYENWECDIVWDDSSQQKKINRGKGGWVYQQNEDETTVSTKLRKIMTCNNTEIITGKWVNGILWDSDTTFTIDITSDNDYDGDNNDNTNDNDNNDSDSETDEINYSSYFNSNKYGYNSQFIGRRKRNYSEDYDYSENIPLVNTAEIIDKYLPHHQEEEMEAERKKKEEEERKKRMTIPPPITTSQPDQNSQGNTNDSVVKNTAYRQQQAREKDERLAKITAGFLAAPANNTNNINSTSDTTQNLQAANNRRKKLNASIELEHSSIASRHLNCKVSLKESELKYYHRPRGKGVQAVWNISFDSRKNKNKLTHRRSHVRQHLVNQIRTLNDLTLLEGDFICVEYIEEHPNAVMNPGMASKIINYYRQPPEDKIQSTQPNQEDNINDDGPTTLSSSKTDTIKRIPRHLQHLQQNSTSSDTSNNIDMIDIPKLPEGITEVLENDDPFPFIGNIEPGAPPQPCLHTNLFRAPLFSQQPKQTDFLLIRNPINRKNVHFILRQLPALFTCGQQEPLMVVTKTGKKKSLNPLQNNFLMLHITRYFLNQGSLTSDPIVSYHDIYREFEFFFKRYRNDAKRCLARVADDIGDEMWKRKPLNQIVPVEEYEIKFSPEDVCLQERALCSEFQLQELGINQLMEVPKMQQGIQRMNKLEKFRKKVLDMVKDEAQLCSKTPKGFRLETLAEILEYHLKKLRHQLEVGRFIYETIQLTPWIITESFVKGYLEKGGDGRFRLRGLGDPSGIGEAFSFLRPTKSSEKRQEDIFNTDRDLRKLPAKQLDELLMPWCTPEEIKSYPRWDKVALIRTFANIAKKENKAHELHKFARDEKTTHQSSLGQFKEGCLEIWKAQAKSLSTQWRDINEDGSDDDDDDDDDDTFDDLDDLDDDLATNIENKSGPSTSTSQGGRGRKKEDEETKEFRTIQTGQFFDGIAPNPSNPSTLSTTTPNQSGTSNNNNNNSNNKINILELKQSEFLLSSEKVEWIPPKQVLKRITRKINSDGTEVIEVKFIVSEIEVKRVLSQKANPNAITNNNQPNSRNRLTNSHYSQNGEDIFEEERTESHSLKINIGKIKSKADKHVQEKQQKKAYQELEESREFDRYNRPMRTSKDRLNAKRGKVARNMRLPHVLFASTLEEIIIGIIKRKNSTPFLYPVDTTKFKDYLSIVARPICLLDIRDNITKYKYSTVDLFLEDLQLMAKNCELFNGSNHTLTKEAYQIYNETVELINVDRDILGKDKDQYIVQQNDIRTKFNQLKRPLHSTITIPNMMPRTVDDPFIQSNKTSNQPFITPKNIDTEFDELGFGFGDADFDFDIDTNEDTALLSTSNNSTTVRSSVNDNNNNNNSQTNHSNNNNDNLKSINTTITPTSFTNTPTPTSSAQIEVKQGFSMEDVFGDDSSSSGEEEVLEEGTF